MSSGGGLTKAVFGSGFFLKELLLRFGVTRLPGVDDVVFGKIKQRLGGRVRIIVSGGAPLAAHVEHFLKVTMCCPVTQARPPDSQADGELPCYCGRRKPARAPRCARPAACKAGGDAGRAACRGTA